MSPASDVLLACPRGSRYTSVTMKFPVALLLGGLVAASAICAQDTPAPAVEGYVTRTASGSDFDVNGFRILCGADTQTSIVQHQSGEFLTTQGCPPDAPYLGRPMKIYGSMKKKRHAIEAARIELLPAFTGGITGSAVIDALPAPDSADAQPGSLMVRADGYRILIGGKTAIALDPPLSSLTGVTAGDWIEYKGKRRADGVVEAESVKLSPNIVGKGEEKLRARYEFDPAAVPPSAKQNTASAVIIGIKGKRFPPYKDAAMQARVSAIGAKLVPAYQRVLPDSDPAKINFRFQVIDTKWFRDALALPSGIILVPRQVVERMQNDSQLATVLADNIACALEKQEYRFQTVSETLTAAGLGAVAAGFFVPGVGLGADAASAGQETILIKTENQSGRVSLGLLRDAGYDIDQAPVTWWLLASKHPQPLARTTMPRRAAYDYRMLGENWRNPAAASSKP